MTCLKLWIRKWLQSRESLLPNPDWLHDFNWCICLLLLFGGPWEKLIMPLSNGRSTGEVGRRKNQLELLWPHEERGKHLGLIPPCTPRALYNNIELMSEAFSVPVKAKKKEDRGDCTSFSRVQDDKSANTQYKYTVVLLFTVSTWIKLNTYFESLPTLLGLPDRIVCGTAVNPEKWRVGAKSLDLALLAWHPLSSLGRADDCQLK